MLLHYCIWCNIMAVCSHCGCIFIHFKSNLSLSLVSCLTTMLWNKHFQRDSSGNKKTRLITIIMSSPVIILGENTEQFVQLQTNVTLFHGKPSLRFLPLCMASFLWAEPSSFRRAGSDTDLLIRRTNGQKIVESYSVGIGGMWLQSVLLPLLRLYLCGIKVLIYQMFNRSFTLPGLVIFIF